MVRGVIGIVPAGAGNTLDSELVHVIAQHLSHRIVYRCVVFRVEVHAVIGHFALVAVKPASHHKTRLLVHYVVGIVLVEIGCENPVEPARKICRQGFDPAVIDHIGNGGDIDPRSTRCLVVRRHYRFEVGKILAQIGGAIECYAAHVEITYCLRLFYRYFGYRAHHRDPYRTQSLCYSRGEFRISGHHKSAEFGIGIRHISDQPDAHLGLGDEAGAAEPVQLSWWTVGNGQQFHSLVSRIECGLEESLRVVVLGDEVGLDPVFVEKLASILVEHQQIEASGGVVDIDRACGNGRGPWRAYPEIDLHFVLPGHREFPLHDDARHRGKAYRRDDHVPEYVQVSFHGSYGINASCTS